MSADAMRDARSEPEDRLCHVRRPGARVSRAAAGITRCKPRACLAWFGQTGSHDWSGARRSRAA
ncbi:hypothetical protein [Caballeronia ptereochthonis]|uniref:hypothetical protein n=1 Tax=Caballeronia ptereochthonis TaxID=1777144 RepID=UPI000A712133|nr:hypothetical protein [Caballeronia ptereochthonis]